MEADLCWCTGEFAGSGLRLRMLRPGSDEGMEMDASDRLRRF
jgi:hypothetical protein